MMQFLARLRDKHWRWLIAKHGKDSKHFRNARQISFWNGIILLIGGIVLCVQSFFIAEWNLWQQIGNGLFSLIPLSGGGLWGIYFSRWSDDNEEFEETEKPQASE
ncbi:MAG: hypothetical protein Tsb009_04390 [Planctomycetaceae bacterium]